VSKRQAPRLSGQIVDEATTWFGEFIEGELSQSAREEFIRGLRTSRTRALLLQSLALEDAGTQKSKLDVEELIALARRPRQFIASGSAPYSQSGRAALRRICGFHPPMPAKPAVAALPSQLL